VRSASYLQLFEDEHLQPTRDRLYGPVELKSKQRGAKQSA
jgi:hypothetical protein